LKKDDDSPFAVVFDNKVSLYPDGPIIMRSTGIAKIAITHASLLTFGALMNHGKRNGEYLSRRNGVIKLIVSRDPPEVTSPLAASEAINLNIPPLPAKYLAKKPTTYITRKPPASDGSENVPGFRMPATSDSRPQTEYPGLFRNTEWGNGMSMS